MVSKPNYGVDAPGVMAGLLGAGLALMGVAWWASPWPWVRWVVGVVSVVPFGLGCAMAVYAIWGKRRTRECMLRMIPWRGDETVLDVGTGRGFLAAGVARRTTGKVIGLDIWRQEDLSGNGRQAAERNLELDGLAGRVTFVEQSASEMKLTDASVDVVVSLLCIHNIESEAGQRAACHEIARVLKPGGTAVLADYLPTHNYAHWLREAGLDVQESRARFEVAWSLMWILRAQKR